MSMTDNAAPVSTDTAAATTDAAAANGSSSAPATDWTAALPEDTRATVSAKGWKSPADAVKSYRDLMREYTETKTKAIVPPGDDAKPEDWNAFYAKLGRPEAPDGYEFSLPEGLPENLPYDADQANKFKLWAHEAGLPKKQAQIVHDKFVKDYAEQLTRLQEDHAKQVATAHEKIVKEWGPPDSETYQRNQELANRAIRQLGGTELLGELKTVGAFGPNGEVKTPRLAAALAKIGEELYAEDATYGGPGGDVNPFAKGPNFNETQQGQILRSDPDRARTLIRLAGDKPEEFGL
jgi:hypothetical protein